MPPTITLSPETIRRARVFWLQSGDDLKLARGRLRRGRHRDGSFLSLQAAVNALSTVCRLNGHFILAQHGVRELLGLCAEWDGRFADLLSAGLALETVPEQNPFSAETNPEEAERFARACLAEAERIADTARNYLKEHRQQFFAP